MVKYYFDDLKTPARIFKNGEYIDLHFKLRIGGFSIVHTHDFYEIIIIKKNSIVNVLDEVKTVQSAPTFALVYPENVHCIECLENEELPEYYNIVINKYFFREIASLINENYQEKLTDSAHYFLCDNNLYQTVIEQLDKALSLPQSATKERQLLLKNVVIKLLTEYFTFSTRAKTKNIVKQILYAMSQPQNMQLKFHEIANFVGYCPEHIIRLFAKQNLPTPNKKFMQIKLDYSCSLLVSTTYSIIEISEIIGISEVSYFNKVFKKQYGIAPTVYRKNHGTPI